MALKDSINEGLQKFLPICPYVKLIATMPKEDAEALEKAMADKVSVNVINNALHKEGYKCADTTLYNHRNGSCVCATKPKS